MSAQQPRSLSSQNHKTSKAQENGASSDRRPQGSRKKRRRTLKAAERPTLEAFQEDYTCVLGIYRFPTELRLASEREMLEVGRNLGINAALLDRLKEAIRYEEVTFQHERARAAQDRAMYSPRSRSLGYQVTRILSAISQSATLTLKSFDESDPRHQAALRLQMRAFPGGLSPLIHQPLRVQHSNIAAIIRENFLKDCTRDISILGLEGLLDRLIQVHAAFGSSLQSDKSKEKLRFSELEDRRREGQHLFGSLIIRILGAYPERDPQSQAIRDALIAPVLFHNNALAQSQRRERKANRSSSV